MSTSKQIRRNIIAILAEYGYRTTPKNVADVYHNHVVDDDPRVDLEDAMAATFGMEWMEAVQ